MPIRTSPPRASTRFPRNDPIRLPSIMPEAVKVAATNPIINAGAIIVEPIIARERPTARASMLVATDNKISLLAKSGASTAQEPDKNGAGTGGAPEEWGANPSTSTSTLASTSGERHPDNGAAADAALAKTPEALVEIYKAEKSTARRVKKLCAVKVGDLQWVRIPPGHGRSAGSNQSGEGGNECVEVLW